ncbi:MAG: fatty acyl-AMP ligase, partial [Acidobacteria bacterium]|nr:fatty acyl-AMP ligase [Acidobacteriota bacterium]
MVNQNPRSPADLPTIVGRLRHWAEKQPEAPAFVWLADGEVEEARLSFGELDRAASRVAARLVEAGAVGECALLLFPPGLDFVAAFLGCLRARTVAVPSYPPRPRRQQPRLRAMAADCRPRFVLTDASLSRRREELRESVPELAEAIWLELPPLGELVAEEAPVRKARWEGPEPAPEDLAFLQYTSGSTSLPKGVMVLHRNLSHNQEMIRKAFGNDGTSVILGWLPLFHDMGLIGNVLQPLWLGARCILMSPMAFLQRPLRWLEGIHRYRATTSGGPNFAYDLCAQRIGEEERAALDLSSWQVAFNGSEPVRAATLSRFAETFAPCGFDPAAAYPCYGLAEATLFVTGAEAGGGFRSLAVSAAVLEKGRAEAETGDGARHLVSSGRIAEDLELRLTDPETGAVRADGEVGEIQVRGASVAAGYWNRPEATAATFQTSESGPWLATGDLGFAWNGELFVTGRI